MQEIAGDLALEAQVTKGEQQILDGKAAHRRGSTKKAYEQYCRGLQYLLDVTAKLGEDKPKAQALRQRINGYLDEAEKLKQEVDPAATLELWPNDEKAPSAEGSGGGDGSDRTSAAVATAATAAAAQDGGALRALADKGEALIEQGRQLEETNQLDEAYEKYCRGLQYLLEVMPKMTEDTGLGGVRGKISGYLEQAERLKERLEANEQESGNRLGQRHGARCSQDRSRSGGSGGGAASGNELKRDREGNGCCSGDDIDSLREGSASPTKRTRISSASIALGTRSPGGDLAGRQGHHHRGDNSRRRKDGSSGRGHNHSRPGQHRRRRGQPMMADSRVPATRTKAPSAAGPPSATASGPLRSSNGSQQLAWSKASAPRQRS